MNNDRVDIIEEQHGTIEQSLMTRQRDCELLSSTGRGQQPLPLEVGGRKLDDVNRVMTLQTMKPFGECRFKTAA